MVNKWLARKVKAPSLMVGIAWPNMAGVKSFKLSSAAMGPSPLKHSPVHYANTAVAQVQVGAPMQQYQARAQVPMQYYQNLQHAYAQPHGTMVSPAGYGRP